MFLSKKSDLLYKGRGNTGLVIILGLLALLTIIFFWISQGSQEKQDDRPQNTDTPAQIRAYYDKDYYGGLSPSLVEGISPTWNRMGDPDADLVIVEFGDFTCPYCAEAFPIIRKLATEHQNDLLYIYRDYTPGQNALKLALASHCAGEQDAFWEIHDTFFLGQGNMRLLTDNDILNRAASLNVDIKQFASCMNSRKYMDLISTSNQTARKLLVNGTPTWFINGEKMSGVIDENKLREIINAFANE